MERPFKQKVLITGITGFTGVYLEKKLLKQGFLVYGTSLKNITNKNHFFCDILDDQGLLNILNEVKPDFIVHLAAISFVAAKDKQSIYNVNVFGTLNLLEAINKLTYIPKKILIASSAAVYGNIEGELDESMCPKPINHYGNSKLVMENMLRPYFAKQNIIITRPFNYTGKGQGNHFLIPKIVSHFLEKKKDISLGNINVYREFNDVNFVVNCYINLLLSSFKSDVVNVCTGNALNIKYIISSMEALSGYKINVSINPKFVRKNEIKMLKGSTKKLASIVDVVSHSYNIENTLKNFI